jgi:gas vesicle protein
MQPEDRFDFDTAREDRCRWRSHEDGFGGGRFLLGILAGAAVGAGLAILFAPQSGEESRDDIRHAGETLRDKTTESYEDARATVEEWIAQARAKVEDTRQRLDEAVEAGRLAAERKRAELDAQVDASLDA